METNKQNITYSEEEWAKIRDAKIEAQDIVYRLRKRAEIRRQIPSRKSVQEGKEDRIALLLEEAATEIEKLRNERTGMWEDAAGADL